MHLPLQDMGTVGCALSVSRDFLHLRTLEGRDVPGRWPARGLVMCQDQGLREGVRTKWNMVLGLGMLVQGVWGVWYE